MYEEILKASTRIAGRIHTTPVQTSAAADAWAGKQLFFKCENFQKTGSFKARGALNAVLKAKDENPKLKGVVTHSSGNHGQALAWAARQAQLQCTVVVPEGSPLVKCNAIQSYGAELIYCAPNPQARYFITEKIVAEFAFLFVPSSDHHDVIAGQGTIATEFLSQVPDLDAILVPISGGGMTSGIAVAAKNIRPETKVFAVEPEGKDLQASLMAEQRLWKGEPKFLDTIADGIRLQQVDHLTFPLLCKYAESTVFSASDEEMVSAMKFIWQQMKIVVEVSSSAGLAAAVSSRMKEVMPELKKIGVILCGGNVDIDKLPW
ncbi:hypothetical protein CAPTEDRAFT_133965 [Capitella teleta]|uniref:L-serine ammonia-lyase n=1 Tax=Capitella teleta TaxID=283909 RepID=R7V7B9_CAPTE|nr:hypothetical protein CAPTEDRAFT_133965 [Capitella teleta]|eukprot:ELU14464.1 hypothetical protein CAPTEDRAFT_133965 [Capitella teleta]